MIRSKKITNSARDEDCTLNIVGVCNHDPETTVFAHLPSEDKGMGRKSSDICGCYACSACHDMLDGRDKSFEFSSNADFYTRRAHLRTLERLFEKGMLCIK